MAGGSTRTELSPRLRDLALHSSRVWSLAPTTRHTRHTLHSAVARAMNTRRLRQPGAPVCTDRPRRTAAGAKQAETAQASRLRCWVYWAGSTSAPAHDKALGEVIRARVRLNPTQSLTLS